MTSSQPIRELPIVTLHSLWGISDWGQSGNELIWKISSGVISDWGQSENELIWENQFWGISDWGQSGNELIWENQFWGYL